jgi:hypothetical protein
MNKDEVGSFLEYSAVLSRWSRPTFQRWCRLYALLKRRSFSTILHGAISQKAIIILLLLLLQFLFYIIIVVIIITILIPSIKSQSISQVLLIQKCEILLCGRRLIVYISLTNCMFSVMFCVFIVYIININLAITLIRTINEKLLSLCTACIFVLRINLGEMIIPSPSPVFRSLCNFC